jgi:hypothetical protein
MDLEALALTVDEQVRVPAAERQPGRLYAVRNIPDPDPGADGAAHGGGSDDHGGDDPPPPACPSSSPGAPAAAADDGVVLELLAEGEARTLPRKVRPPAGLRAIALSSGVWAAPLEDGDDARPPSRHPDRRRAHLTVVVGPEGTRDGVEVSVLRYADGSPTVLRGGVGLIHQRMLRCWSRRPDAPGRRASAA